VTALNAATADARQSAPYQWLTRYPKAIDWHRKLTPAPLYELLDTAAAKFGSRPCTNFLGKVLTYREIARMVDRAAAGLQKLGVKKGTKVGLFMPNCPTFIVYYFATLKAGGTVVNYNPLYTLEELAFQIKDSETELMVTLDLKLLFDKVEGLMKAGTLKRAIVASFPALLPGAKSVLFKLFKARSWRIRLKSPVAANVIRRRRRAQEQRQVREAGDRPCERRGRAAVHGRHDGTPKGAMLTHANVHVNCQQGAAWAPNLVPGQERTLAALPFFHVFAMTAVMNFALAQGAEIVIMPRFVLDDAMALITKTRPTVMPGVPDHVHRHAEPSQAHQLRSVVAQVLPVGGRAAPRRGEGEVREAHRLQGRGGLRPVRGEPQRHLQSDRRTGQGGLDRAAAPGHHRVAARPCRSDQGGACWARRAKSASRARRS
jgi:long-chain acyl-CoA synthetase